MKDEIRLYLRYHPKWYLQLSRYPNDYERLIQEYHDVKNQNFINKVEQVAMFLNMIEMMM